MHPIIKPLRKRMLPGGLAGTVLILLISFGRTQLIMAQTSLQPTLAPFSGPVYRIPYHQREKGYGGHLSGLTPISKITLEKLDVPATNDSIPLQHIEMRKATAFLLNSTVHFPESGEYEFTLTSDDGSRLWIADTLVVYNDVPQRTRTEKRRRYYEKGIYPVKLWYFQGWNDEYRLELEIIRAEQDTFGDLRVVLQDKDVHFDFDSPSLTGKGETVIGEFLHSLKGRVISRITIKGHTDSLGAEQYNIELSRSRALAVKDILEDKLPDFKGEYLIEGYGESAPIAPNSTAEGRSRNRRVEINIEFGNKPNGT